MFLDFIRAKVLLLVLTLFAVYLLFLAAIIIVCFSFFGIAIENYYAVEKAYFEFIIFSNIVFSGLFFTLLPTLNILDRFLAFSISSISYAVLSLLVPYLLLLYVSRAWEVWLIGVAITQLILLVATLRVFNFYEVFEKWSVDIGRKALEKLDYKSVLSFCAPLAAANILGFSLYNGFRFFLVEDVGAFEYGKFVAGYTIAAGFCGIVEQVITALYQPKIYQGLATGSITSGLALWNKSVETLVVYLIAVLGLLLLVGDELTLVVYGNSLGDIDLYLKLALFLEVLRVIASAMLFYFQISKATSKIYYYYFTAIPLALLFIYILPWTSILETWVLSIALGCCCGLGLTMLLIFRRNAFMGIDYMRIIKAIIVSSVSVYILDGIAGKILNIRSSEFFLLVVTISFLVIFIASDFFGSKFFVAGIGASKPK